MCGICQSVSLRSHIHVKQVLVGVLHVDKIKFQRLVLLADRYIFINNYRKKVKANTILDTTDNQFYLNSGSHATGNGAETNIMLKELNTMIEGLDDSIRVPFLMHFEGFKYQEIADELDLPLGTVKSRIFFARKELKDKILSNYGFHPN